MDIQENQNTGCGADAGCGCHTDIFTTDEKCQSCGGRLRLAGRSQLMEFRMECSSCGWASTVLSQEELHRVL